MRNKRILLIGGSGFVGSALANRLAAASCDIIIPTRRASRAGHLLLQPTVTLVEENIHEASTLARLCTGADAVINLTGILHSRSGTPYGPDFAHVHVELVQKLVYACRTTQVPRLIHISALGAADQAPSEYLRSKAAGEAVITGSSELAWTILRPSAIFGRYDRFLNLFAEMSSLFPVLPLAGSQARFQPVYVEDVVEVIYRSLNTPDSAGQTFEVAGPTVYTLRQLFEYVSRLVGNPCPIIPLPDSLAMLQAWLLEFAPQPLISRDALRSMTVPNTATGTPLPFEIPPTPLEAVVPGWLGKNSRARYNPLRRYARRSQS